MKKKRFIHIIACMSTLFLFMAELSIFWASLIAQLIKNLPAIWETCWEDALEKGKATHSSVQA